MNTTFNLDKLVRPNIKKLAPYQSARQNNMEGLMLDANENSLGAPFDDKKQLHRYPDPSQHELRGLIAEWRGLRKENVFVGVGSDEGIDLLYRIFCNPKRDRVITVPPTYGMYRVSANIHDITVVEIPLEKNSFQPQPDKILRSLTENTKMLFLCSPNNPTGNVFDEDRVTALVNGFPGIVVLDEAYIDFSNRESWSSKVTAYPNLVVLQTMSKSFGLAGIRLGIAYAREDIIDYMMKIKAPYNISKLTQRQAIKGLKNFKTVRFHIDAIKKERKKIRDKLEKLEIVQRVYPSEANFLLIKVSKAKNIHAKLAEQNIFVRYRGDEPLCENCLRLTVGTPDENERLISALKKLTS